MKDEDQQARIEDMLVSLRRLVGTPAPSATRPPDPVAPDPVSPDMAPPQAPQEAPLTRQEPAARKTVVLGPDLRCDRPDPGATEAGPANAPAAEPPETTAPEPRSNLFADATAPAADPELRLLVSALLREELSGPLGERLSAGLRELVRAEIARALADTPR